MNTRLTLAAAVATVLASIALYPLLDSGGWFWAGIGAVTVVAVVGAATRRRAIPAVLCFLAAVGGLFLYLNVVFAGRQSWAGLVPTGASLHHMQLLLQQAMTETSKNAPPVPARPGIVLLTVAGIGFVAVLTDVLAVRLHRPALAGLPLLVLFCVPLTTDARPGAVGATLVFCAGIVGYLGLLSADSRHRLRLWGRLIHPWQDDADSQGPDVRPLAAAGRRIGSAAVVLALALPLLIPGLKAHRLFSGDGTGKGSGPGSHSQVTLPKPLDLLNTDLHENHAVPVLSYRSTESTPPYLQVYVLSNLNTNAWTMPQPAAAKELSPRGLPPAPGLDDKNTPGPVVQETITLGTNLARGGNVSYLPLPYPARQVRVSGDWRVDGNTLSVLSTSARLAGLHYSVTARDLNPTSDQLRRQADVAPSQLADELSVPEAYQTTKMKRLVDHITAGRTTNYGKAVAIQQWFTTPGRFTYSLDVSQTQSASALIQFLTKSRKGYCQQFAFAMAVLARLAGIPARVVVGYTQGTFSGNNTWQVKTSDAHAWPELYFPTAGWLRFEPTPPNTLGLAGQATASAPPYSIPLDTTGTGTGTQSGLNTPSSSSSAGANPVDPNASLNRIRKNAPGGAAGSGGHRSHGTPPIVPVAIALLVVMLIAPATMRALGRRWRWWRAQDDISRAHVAWHELRNDLTDYRISHRASESPRALSRRITKSLGLADAERDALERIALAEERASYAASPAGSARLKADEALVRRAVARSCPTSGRFLAIVAPPSALIPVQAAAQQLLDVFGWMELATTRARRRLAPRDGQRA
ncbi:MAG: transglutaminase domain-containing protein, partial [Actinobacteria bacterium]|nr:transglutaminase domain-containing protein [Actinomycetota bacterium]